VGALAVKKQCTEDAPLPENGEVGRGRASENSFDNVKAIGGTSESYRLRRLRRDNLRDVRF
jgi:hypothetical protein